MARAPTASTAATVSFRVPGSLGWGSIVLAAQTILQPSLARATAQAAPTPREAPVIMATRSLSLIAGSEWAGRDCADYTVFCSVATYRHNSGLVTEALSPFGLKRGGKLPGVVSSWES